MGARGSTFPRQEGYGLVVFSQLSRPVSSSSWAQPVGQCWLVCRELSETGRVALVRAGLSQASALGTELQRASSLSSCQCLALVPYSGMALSRVRWSRGKMPTVGHQGREQAASLQQVGWAGR